MFSVLKFIYDEGSLGVKYALFSSKTNYIGELFIPNIKHTSSQQGDDLAQIMQQGTEYTLSTNTSPVSIFTSTLQSLVTTVVSFFNQLY
jgi:hypothetical protein